MKMTDYLAMVAKTMLLNVVEGGNESIETKCQKAIDLAIETKARITGLNDSSLAPDDRDFLDLEWSKIDADERVLQRRLTQAGSLVSDESVYEALNHVFAVSQALGFLCRRLAGTPFFRQFVHSFCPRVTL